MVTLCYPWGGGERSSERIGVRPGDLCQGNRAPAGAVGYTTCSLSRKLGEGGGETHIGRDGVASVLRAPLFYFGRRGDYGGGGDFLLWPSENWHLSFQILGWEARRNQICSYCVASKRGIPYLFVLKTKGETGTHRPGKRERSSLRRKVLAFLFFKGAKVLFSLSV